MTEDLASLFKGTAPPAGEPDAADAAAPDGPAAATAGFDAGTQARREELQAQRALSAAQWTRI